MVAQFFIIIKSWFLTHFVVCHFLLVRPKDGMEQKARIWTVELFVVQVVLLQPWLQISHFSNLYIKIDWAIFRLSRQLAELDLYVILYFLAERNNTPPFLSHCAV